MGPRISSWWTTLTGLLCGSWAFAFVAPVSASAATPLSIGVAAGVAMLRRQPVGGGAVVAAVTLASRAVDLPVDNPWVLPGWLAAVYSLGRYERRAVASVPVAAVLWLALVSAEPAAPTMAFGAVVATIVWVLGRVVRQSSVEAVQAAREADRLAAVDAEGRTEQIAAEERARLADDVLEVLRAAVTSMRRHASAAALDLGEGPLVAIQEEGRWAATELRQLLGILRSVGTELRPADEPTLRPRPSRPRRAVLASTVLVLLVIEATVAVVEEGLALGAPAAILSLSLAAVALFAHRQPHASLFACLVPGAALMLDLTLPYGLWSAVVAATLLWEVAAVRGLLPHATSALFALLFLLDVHQHAPGNEAITLITLVLAATVGHLWATRRRKAHDARVATATLEAHHAALAEQAVRVERLRVARELHDVASHAVGVMTLQAGAAIALRDRNPQDAAAAVSVIQQACDDALHQLDRLTDLLHSGLVGDAGHQAAMPAADLHRSLTHLVERMRQTGMAVDLCMQGDPSSDPADRATIYRIVQESLTNVVRHAPGSAVRVSVVTDEAWEVVVADDGAGRRQATDGPTGGFGLLGLAERVEALGGHFRAGASPDGGFTVRARLPRIPAARGQR